MNYKVGYATEEEKEELNKISIIIRSEQTDSTIQEANPSMGRAGCYVRSLQSIVEEYTGKTLTAEQINKMMRELNTETTILNGRMVPLVRNDMYVNSSKDILKKAFMILDSDIVDVEFVTGDKEHDAMVKRYEQRHSRDKYYTNEPTKIQYEKGSIENTHFVHVYKDKFVNNNSNLNMILFDPDPVRATVLYTVAGDPYTLKPADANFYYTHSYRYIKFIKR